MAKLLILFSVIQLLYITASQQDCSVTPGGNSLTLPPPEFPDFMKDFEQTIQNFPLLFGENFVDDSGCASKVDWTTLNLNRCSNQGQRQRNYIDEACQGISTRPPVSPFPSTSRPSGGNATAPPPEPVQGQGSSTPIIAGVVCGVGGLIIITALVILIFCRGERKSCDWFHSMKSLRRQKSELRPITAETPSITSPSTTPADLFGGIHSTSNGSGTLDRARPGKDNFVLLREDSSASAVFPDIYADGATGKASGIQRHISLSVIGESSSDLTLQKKKDPKHCSPDKYHPDIDLMRFNSVSVDETKKRVKIVEEEETEFEIIDDDLEKLARKKSMILEQEFTEEEEEGEDQDGASEVVGAAGETGIEAAGAAGAAGGTGIKEAAETAEAAGAASEALPTDQTLKRNLRHYVDSKDKPIVAKKTSFINGGAKQKALQRQKSMESNMDEHGTDDRPLHERISIGLAAGSVGFDNQAFIPDTPTSENSPRTAKDQNEEMEENVDELEDTSNTIPPKMPLNIQWDEWVEKTFDSIMDLTEPSENAEIKPVQSAQNSLQRRRAQLRHADSDVNNETVTTEPQTPTSTNSNSSINDENEHDLSPVNVAAAAAKFEDGVKKEPRQGNFKKQGVVVNKPGQTFFPPTSPKVQNVSFKKPSGPVVPVKSVKPGGSSPTKPSFPTSPKSPKSSTPPATPAKRQSTSSSKEEEVLPSVTSIREQFEQKKDNSKGEKAARPVSNNLNKK